MQDLFKTFESIESIRVRKYNSLERVDCQSKLPKHYMRGLYFLLMEGKVVYVGMSDVCVTNRIFGDDLCSISVGHIGNKVFTKIKLLDMNQHTKRQILDLEKKYIKMFNPYYNHTHKSIRRSNLIPLRYFNTQEYKKGVRLYNNLLEVEEKEAKAMVMKFHELDPHK